MSKYHPQLENSICAKLTGKLRTRDIDINGFTYVMHHSCNLISNKEKAIHFVNNFLANREKQFLLNESYNINTFDLITLRRSK